MLTPLLITFVLASATYAQSDAAWMFSDPDTTRGSQPLAFFADDTGNVYVAGWSEPGSDDRCDVLLLKIDSLGHLVWARTYDSVTASDAERDTSGNIYVAGVTNGRIGGAQICLLKYRPNGDLEWAKGR